MKVVLIVFLSFFILACTPNRALLISKAEQGQPEDYCADNSYRTCTNSGTYRECLSELRPFVPPCSRKSFPRDKSYYSREEFMDYHRDFSLCLLVMHITDKSEKGEFDSNPMCEERGFYEIRERAE